MRNAVWLPGPGMNSALRTAENHARVSGEDAVASPNHTTGHQLVREQAEFGGGFRRWFAGDIKHAGDADAAVGDRDGEVADFIDQAGVEHGAVEFTAALKHQFSKFERVGELVEGNFQIDFLRAAE